ncbi:sugar phosphate isomerase/epimerase [Alkalihalobacillus oceani]|uniref:sugar phosphate isomerase/epimerase family protein n=1 Tax=Halalkalibacter oceani TaxID=1653776 RepID=UPI00203C9321|nr:sugar phosphate isomerase/epimerase [Halalkalibacter oceani]MCM3761336.1 sugar phosphate isomerase/epimerase [Halalkalibacter oceani]
MKYAFHSGSMYDIPLEEVIKKLTEYGYDAIEINGEKLPWIEDEKDIHIRSNMTEKEIKELRSLLEKNQLEVSAISAHLELIEKDPVKRSQVISHSKTLISHAKLLGTDVVHGLSGFKPENMSDEECWDILIEVIDEIVEYAEEVGVKYAFEAVVGMFINSGEKLKELRSKMTKGTLYVNFDPSHLILVKDDIPQLIREFGEDIVHVHFKDGTGETDNYEFPPVGKGEVNIPEFVKVLKEVGYDDYVSIEYEANYFGNYSSDISQVAKESIEIMKDYIE